MSRAFIAAVIAFIISALALGGVVTPAAATTTDCVAMPAQLRAAAATAEPAKARKALSSVRTGEALCAADNSFEAGRKFRAAATALGLDAEQLVANAPATN